MRTVRSTILALTLLVLFSAFSRTSGTLELPLAVGKPLRTAATPFRH